MIGGTGLLGSEASKELIARGHDVLSVALPPLPTGAVLSPEMKIEYGNYLEMTDDEIRAYLIDGGLQMVKFADLMCSNLFIDKKEGCIPLGVTEDDIDAAIGDSILLCKSVIEGKTQVLGMKGE